MTDAERRDESLSEERAYEAPALVVLGPVGDLTAGLGGSLTP